MTDGNGFCTVTHGLGKVPEAIAVSLNTPKTFGQIWFTYAAYGPSEPPSFPTTSGS
ncbi:hypothetical protein AB0C38_08765 [Amycolatopsis sp. NPDC048633]|uniref:hypothetical protein n=1 Tax=Amycolatopsis sp. NPDC048633 TaxID=3157095 RepID=UPI0033CF8AD7